jgi:hypothetical protein
MAVMPLRTQHRGPAPTGNFDNDIIDEALYFFKSNVFFRTYEVKVKLHSVFQPSLLDYSFFSQISSRKSTGFLSTSRCT